MAAEIVQEHQLPRALQLAKSRSLRVGQVLIMLRYLSAEDLEPILQIQRLINDGSIGRDAAIDILKVMRRDGLPLTRAVELVQKEPPEKEEKLRNINILLDQLQTMERETGAETRDLVPLLIKLGDARLELREPLEADKLYKRALSILEHSHGNKNIKTLPALHKVVELYMLQQKYAEAETTCWRIVEINQAAFGPEHLEAARALQKLARILDAQKKYAEAEQFLLSAIRIMEGQLGIENGEMKSALRHLSTFWKRKTKTSENKRIGELLVESQLITTECLSAALADAQKQGVPLGQMLVKMEAIHEGVLRAGLQAQLLVQDGVVPSTVATKALRLVAQNGISFEDALEELGWQPDPISTGDLQKLMDTSDELMAAEKALGANHPGVAALALKLGEQYTFARKFALAESAYKRSLSILKQCFGQNNIELATCMYKLGSLYYVQKRFTEAEPLHWRALEIRKLVLGDDHPDVASSLEQIANLASAQGNDGQAESMRQAAALIRSKDSFRRKELAAFLRDSTVFKLLEERMLERVSGLVEEMEFKSGHVVVQDREQPSAIYIVFDGSVELVHNGTVTAYVTTGECFGDLEYPQTEEHHGTARVPESARVLRLSSTICKDLKSKSPDLQKALSDIAARRTAGNTSLAASAQPSVLQGNLAFFDLSTVLQTIVNARKDGYLRLSNHKKEEVARLAIRNGALCNVRYRHLQGLSAIFDLLTRNDPLEFVFEQQEVVEEDDPTLVPHPLTALLMEAARRSDELPLLLESVGWPRTSFVRNARMLDTSSFPNDIGSVAADIWLLLEGNAQNEQIEAEVYADRFTFVLALKEMVSRKLIKVDDPESTGSFGRLEKI